MCVHDGTEKSVNQWNVFLKQLGLLDSLLETTMQLFPCSKKRCSCLPPAVTCSRGLSIRIVFFVCILLYGLEKKNLIQQGVLDCTGTVIVPFKPPVSSVCDVPGIHPDVNIYGRSFCSPLSATVILTFYPS